MKEEEEGRKGWREGRRGITIAAHKDTQGAKESTAYSGTHPNPQMDLGQESRGREREGATLSPGRVIESSVPKPTNPR